MSRPAESHVWQIVAVSQKDRWFLCRVCLGQQLRPNAYHENGLFARNGGDGDAEWKSCNYDEGWGSWEET